MESQIEEARTRKMLNDVVNNGERCIKGVNTTPELSAQVSHPIGDKLIDVKNSNDENESTDTLTRRKLESGSGSGEQEGGGHSEDCTDLTAKKRKTRRGKPKHRKMKPYSKQRRAYVNEGQSKCTAMNKLLNKLKMSRQFPAPYNTTQFLMDDHSDLPDLDQKLSKAASSEVTEVFQKPPVPTRTRDSSFSVDSDDNYFYSSPEDEEEFLTKEFSSAYEDYHAERLNSLSKSDLIQEYVQLEAKFDVLAKRFRNKNYNQIEERDSDNKNITMEIDSPKKLKLFQQRIDDLMQQNEQLRRENEILRSQINASVDSSIDSESDSDSSVNEDVSQCSCLDLSQDLRSETRLEKNSITSNSSLDKNCLDGSQNENIKSNGSIPINEINSLST